MKYSLPSLSFQLSTDTKSATKLGISHFTSAEFPTITYSLSASVSYSWVTTRIIENHNTTYFLLELIIPDRTEENITFELS